MHMSFKNSHTQTTVRWTITRMDGGSDINCLSPNTARWLCLETQKRQRNILGIAGSVTCCHSGQALIRLGHCIAELEFAILNLEELDMILGTPAFAPLKLAIGTDQENNLMVLTDTTFAAKGKENLDETHLEICRSFVTQANEPKDNSPQTSNEVSWIEPEFHDVFRDSIPFPPRRDCDHKIELIDPKPICISPYKVPMAKVNEMKRQISELLEEGKITISTSPFFVNKKDSSTPRLCCDYRALNAKTVRNAQPMPSFDMVVSRKRRF